LLNRLSEAEAAAALSTLRMATGHKINSPSDDPSAFVQLSALQSQLGLVSATMSNVTAASSMIGQVQSAYAEVRSQLDAIRDELMEDEGGQLTPEERAVAQSEIDDALDAITELARSSIDGRRLLDGSADYTYSGRDPSQVRDVVARSLPAAGQVISGSVSAAATQAELTYEGTGGQATTHALFVLTGKRGSATIEIEAGEELDSVAETINAMSHATGVTASFDAVNTLTLTSVDYGADATIDIDVLEDTFTIVDYEAGTNAAAVINDRTIAATSSNINGNRFTVNASGFRFEIEFEPGFAGQFDSITVGGEALSFALSTDLGRRSSVAIGSIFPARLGGTSGRLDELYSGGALSGLGTNTSQAIRVVDEALGDLMRMEGTADGFYNASVTSASNFLTAVEEDLQTAIDSIDEVNDAEEEQLVAHYQVLASNAEAGLLVLYQQRSGIIQMIRKIAGLT